jgi:flagellar protein FlaG
MFDHIVVQPPAAAADAERQPLPSRSPAHQEPTSTHPVDFGAAVARLQDHVQAVHRELHFRIDEATGQTVVRVVDTNTGTVVRQMPSQEVLDTLQTIDTMQAGSGLLVRVKA